MKNATLFGLVIIPFCALFMISAAANAQSVFGEDSLVMKNRKEQNLTGEWRIAGYQPGVGYYEGAYAFEPDSAKGDDEYLIERRVRYENGMVLETSGTGTLYGEYHLRYALAPTTLMGSVEGVFDLDAAGGGFAGKWWTVVQDSNSNGDEKFFKVGSPARVFAVYPNAIEAYEGASHKLTLIGIGLPQGVEAEDIKFSDPGVKVEKIEEAGKSKIVCRVKASPGSSGRSVGLTVKGVKCDKPVMIFEGLDGIKIIPALGRARASCGAAYPPQGVQFVAYGLDFGPDNRPGTGDDILLEPLDAIWELEEEVTRENDDDLKYLKAPINNGLYTPVTTCDSMAEREQNREGVGLIAVRASYNDGDRMIGDRALLAVTAPDFISQNN